jgi:glycosyltransferase involved in cell wall biosynthesis
MLTIICLVHNAPLHVYQFMETFLDHPPPCEHELLVLDNGSEEATRAILVMYEGKDNVKLMRSDENLMFSGGNNLAFQHRSPRSEMTLLVNSDVEFLDDRWLHPLVNCGCSIAGYGLLEKPNRPDGWCMLVETALYDKYKMDEDFPFWFGSRKLVSDVLRGGGTACAIQGYEKLLAHEGGASGGNSSPLCAPRRKVDMSRWFDDVPPVLVLDAMSLLV